MRLLLWPALFLTALLGTAAQGVALPPGTIQPGALWNDTAGHPIEAHGGGLLQRGARYYWFGEDRTPGLDPGFKYVSCYESRDLSHWTSHGDALKLASPEADVGNPWVLERPKVYYNRVAKKYVMYFHLDDRGYKLARIGVATSQHVCGPYHYLHSFRPLGQESRDIGQFVDDDGTPYVIFESRPTKGFFIAKLSGDYLTVAEQTAFLPAPLEGGTLVHVGDWYYVLGSHMTGWRPNPDVYAVAHSLRGPWSSFDNIAPPATNTYGSQPTMLWKVQGSEATSVIYMGDIWRPQNLPDSRYLWIPLALSNGKLSLPAPEPWQIDVATGVTKKVPPQR